MAARKAMPPSRASLSCRLPPVSSAAIGQVSRSHTGPASRRSTTRMIEIPDSTSPARIACWMGAAPRQRGSKDACTLMLFVAAASTVGQDQAIGGDDQQRGPGRRIAPRFRVAQARGLLDRHGSAGRGLDRTHGDATTAARGSIRLGVDLITSMRGSSSRASRLGKAKAGVPAKMVRRRGGCCMGRVQASEGGHFAPCAAGASAESKAPGRIRPSRPVPHTARRCSLASFLRIRVCFSCER